MDHDKNIANLSQFESPAGLIIFLLQIPIFKFYQ